MNTQKQVIAAIEKIATDRGLIMAQETTVASNMGVLFIRRGFHVELAIGYDFQATRASLDLDNSRRFAAGEHLDYADGTTIQAALDKIAERLGPMEASQASSVEVTVVPEGVHRFLDLSTGHLPQEEMENITASPKRVIKHEFGAWAYVPSDDSETDFEDVDWDDYPALKAVLMYARTLDDIWWINFDRDAATIDALPTWDW